MLDIITVSLLGGGATFGLSRLPYSNAIRASSVSTLCFYGVLLCITNAETAQSLSAWFFGGSFVGMSDRSRLLWWEVLIASGIFGVLGALLLPLLEGVDGALGVCAFVSVVIVYLCRKGITALKIKFKQPV